MRGARRRNFRSSAQEWGQGTYKLQRGLEYELPFLNSVAVGEFLKFSMLHRQAYEIICKYCPVHSRH